MLQPVRRQTRIPFLALVAVALAVFASISLARITTTSATRTEPAVPTIVRTDIVSTDRPAVQAPTDKTGCGAGAYVSGDIAGETSPTEVYANMCGRP